jgi:hypothetical protein
MEKKALLFKTLLVETENKEESFITEHPNSQLIHRLPSRG